MQNSAEIRWFWSVSPFNDIESWFRSGSFPPGGGRLRLDVYLVDPDQHELGIKKRGNMEGVEVKGLVARLSRPFQVGTLTGHGELWTKWNSPSLRLDTLITQEIYKIRWLRKFEIKGGSAREIQLGEDEKPLNRDEKLPDQGCNLEFTKVSLAKDGPEWSTIGFESFGDYLSVESNLMLTLEHLSEGALPSFAAGEELSYPAWLMARCRS